eukprot:SAG22_NODE_184_length_15968_cov_39.081858_3_plen_206_part_00
MSSVCPQDRVFADLIAAIKDIVKRDNYVVGETWLLKIIQLYQIQFLNHGFMVVGPTANGKTSCWNVLLEAMGRLVRTDDPGNPAGREGRSYVIDPKSMSKEELYGEIDTTTREWTDGVFTKILRKIIDETKSQPIELAKTVREATVRRSFLSLKGSDHSLPFLLFLLSVSLPFLAVVPLRSQRTLVAISTGSSSTATSTRSGSRT